MGAEEQLLSLSAPAGTASKSGRLWQLRRVAQHVKGNPYFNQPRFLKYHMGPSALASISAKT